MTADHPAHGSPAQQGRLAAAARALAAAEEAARRPGRDVALSDTDASAAPVREVTTSAERPEVPSRASEAAQRWVDGLADPAEAGVGAHLDLSSAGRTPLDLEGARQVVLRQLAMGPRSRHQLEDKLRQRRCPDDIAAAVLDRMAAVGLVDDRAYAEMLVRSKRAGRGLAKRALAQELRQKGVDDELVSHALGSIDPESERVRAEELAAKKMRTMSGLDPQVQSRRLSGMLARKGYPPSVVHAVVRDVVNGATEHQRD
ncbi:MAG: recombination regulator RecX [Actinomycetota bacterium]|nr:recombination regulator RecX [Actinomycetota bacterium]